MRFSPGPLRQRRRNQLPRITSGIDSSTNR